MLNRPEDLKLVFAIGWWPLQKQILIDSIGDNVGANHPCNIILVDQIIPHLEALVCLTCMS